MSSTINQPTRQSETKSGQCETSFVLPPIKIRMLTLVNSAPLSQRLQSPNPTMVPIYSIKTRYEAIRFDSVSFNVQLPVRFNAHLTPETKSNQNEKNVESSSKTSSLYECFFELVNPSNFDTVNKLVEISNLCRLNLMFELQNLLLQNIGVEILFQLDLHAKCKSKTKRKYKCDIKDIKDTLLLCCLYCQRRSQDLFSWETILLDDKNTGNFTNEPLLGALSRLADRNKRPVNLLETIDGNFNFEEAFKRIKSFLKQLLQVNHDNNEDVSDNEYVNIREKFSESPFKLILSLCGYIKSSLVDPEFVKYFRRKEIYPSKCILFLKQMFTSFEDILTLVNVKFDVAMQDLIRCAECRDFHELNEKFLKMVELIVNYFIHNLVKNVVPIWKGTNQLLLIKEIETFLNGLPVQCSDLKKLLKILLVVMRILSILTSEEMKHETRENSHAGVKSEANVTDINDDCKQRLNFSVAEPVAVTVAVPKGGPEAVPKNEPVAVPVAVPKDVQAAVPKDVQAAVPKDGQLSVPKAGPESHVQLADVGGRLKNGNMSKTVIKQAYNETNHSCNNLRSDSTDVRQKRQVNQQKQQVTQQKQQVTQQKQQVTQQKQQVTQQKQQVTQQDVMAESENCDLYDIEKMEGSEFPRHQKCRKNPGHKQFIPINQLRKKHLPKGHHDELILNCIKAMSNLTVKIEATRVSSERPERLRHSDKTYPLFSKKGKNVHRCGSGTVISVRKLSSSEGMGCSCQECIRQRVQKKVVGKVRILTSRHVVFDKSEAVTTICKLNYDSESDKVITIPAIDVDESEYGTDICELTCVTCDPDLFNILMFSTINYSIHWKKLHENFSFPKINKSLVFIVSHPHGMPKHVSFGYLKKGKISLSQHSVYTYDTPTCPGSSGALVNIVQQTPDKYLLYNSHVHSAGLEPGLNESALGREYIPMFYLLKAFIETITSLNI